MNDFSQILSLTGAVLVLIAYVAHQLRRMDPNGALYNVLNASGAGLLAYVALRPFQAGFVLLEGTWTLVSLYALYRAVARRT